MKKEEIIAYKESDADYKTRLRNMRVLKSKVKGVPDLITYVESDEEYKTRIANIIK